MNAIPVERPQDVSRAGKGTVEWSSRNGKVVKGAGTNFTEAFKNGGSMVISKDDGSSLTGRVAKVVSDTELLLKGPLQSVVDQKTESSGASIDAGEDGIADLAFHAQAYKILPRVDQSAVFQNVFGRLSKGNIVAIFPEGGSHDRAQLLPLKAGISIMALSAAAGGNPVPILPVGINYFRQWRFRSRVFVDVGQPIIPGPDLIAAFKKGGSEKREACDTILHQCLTGLRTVTYNADSYNELQFFSEPAAACTHRTAPSLRRSASTCSKLLPRVTRGTRMIPK